MKTKVSIVIVHYNNSEKLIGCLSSIYKNLPRYSFEVIVVDNGVKSIAQKLKGIVNLTYIKSPQNLGYGAGNNLGIERAQGEYVLVLNPDTKVYKGTIDTLIRFLDNRPKAAIVAPNLVDKDGKVYAQLGSRKLTPLRGIVALSFINKIYPSNPISHKYWLKDLPMDKLREVDVVPGSAFLVRRTDFIKAGKFDEKMFLYFEEYGKKEAYRGI